MILLERTASERIVEAQKKDKILTAVRRSIIAGNLEDDSLRHFRPAFRSLRIIDDAVVKENKGEKRIVVPEAFKLDVLYNCHNGFMAGHFGQNKAYAILKKRFFWPNMHEDLRKFIDSCKDCAKWKRQCKNTLVKRILSF